MNFFNCVFGTFQRHTLLRTMSSSSSATASVADSDVDVDVDGTLLEGGGQVLRNTVALAALTGKSLRVRNIRGKRLPKPGLQRQHLTGIELVARMFDAELVGGEVNSSMIVFRPRARCAASDGEWTADTQTAGSICLLVQVALPCMIFAGRPSKAVLKGGTNASGAPQIDYFTHCLQPVVARMGVDFDIGITRRGYYPKGGGVVELHTRPVPSTGIAPIVLDKRGVVTKVFIRSYTAGAIPERLA
jgi:RNA 3'-terminal phosphate cyclase (ATP)